MDGVDKRFTNGEQNGLLPPSNAPVNQYGVIEANVEMSIPARNPNGTIATNSPKIWKQKKIRPSEKQTMFLATWTKEEILEQCASAISSGTHTNPPGKSRVFEASSESGVVIAWFSEDVNDPLNCAKILSTFPKF